MVNRWPCFGTIFAQHFFSQSDFSNPFLKWSSLFTALQKKLPFLMLNVDKKAQTDERRVKFCLVLVK